MCIRDSSEPTQRKDSVTVTIDGGWRLDTSDEHVGDSRGDSAMTLHINTAGLGGQSVRVALSRPIIPAAPTPQPSKSVPGTPTRPIKLPRTGV